eukprot:366055-Chlamydomonas_euryale.AAC.13
MGQQVCMHAGAATPDDPDLRSRGKPRVRRAWSSRTRLSRRAAVIRRCGRPRAAVGSAPGPWLRVENSAAADSAARRLQPPRDNAPRPATAAPAVYALRRPAAPGDPSSAPAAAAAMQPPPPPSAAGGGLLGSSAAGQPPAGLAGVPSSTSGVVKPHDPVSAGTSIHGWRVETVKGPIIADRDTADFRQAQRGKGGEGEGARACPSLQA